MIKLKDLIKEVAWEEKTLDHVRQFRVPISAPIMKKVIGDIDMSVFHVAEHYDLPKLKSLVGKKKSLSTFTAVHITSDIARTGRGIQTDGGIIFQLEGKLLASSMGDIGSMPDKTGRRWLEGERFKEIFGWKGRLQDSLLPHLHKNKEFKKIHDKLRLPYNPNPAERSHITGKEKATFIKIYIDEITKLMIKNKTAIKKEFGQNLTALAKDYSYAWNEMVVSNIKINDALIVSDSYAIKTIWDKHKPQFGGESTLAKYKSKEEIIKDVNKVISGKAIWGKLSDIPGFIKSRGGHISMKGMKGY